MKLTKKKKITIAVSVVLSIALLVVCYPEHRRKQQKQNDYTDAVALRSVVAEAFIRTSTDSDFVNTATEDQPMKIPEKYYTYVESVQGDGPVHVVMYADGDVSAYFGTPEKTIGYYAQLVG